MTTELEHTEEPPLPTRREPGRAHRRWTTVLGLMAASLAVWLVLDATTLQHNAQVSPVGTRRTVALSFLNPLASATSVLQLADPERAANYLLGRDGNVPGNGRTFSVVGPTPAEKHATASRPGVTTTTLDPLTHPSAAAPLRVLLLGDSLGLDLGGSLQNSLAATGIVTATLDGKEATGLTRPDYFNWPQELSGDLVSAKPQVIVAMMGANDPQDFLGPPDVPFGTYAWNVEYEGKVRTFMQLATSQGAKLIWVSLPPMQDAGLDARVATVNLLQRKAAAEVPGVLYVRSSKVLGSAYAAFTTVNGQVVNVRTPDGIHITPQGGSLLANRVMAAMRSRLGIPLP
jgi:hypothetical protein